MDREKRYNFFLNPYKDLAFTKCPKCEQKSKQKKLPIVILSKSDDRIFSLNYTCKYCPNCDLLIAKKKDVEMLICYAFDLSVIEEGTYHVMGTMEKALWKDGLNRKDNVREQVENIFPFKNHWDFKIKGGWMRSR